MSSVYNRSVRTKGSLKTADRGNQPFLKVEESGESCRLFLYLISFSSLPCNPSSKDAAVLRDSGLFFPAFNLSVIPLPSPHIL